MRIDEHVISEGMNQLTVPDLETIIWDRVDGLLDGLPGPASPDKRAKDGVPGPRVYLVVIASVIIASIVCLTIVHRDAHPAKREKEKPAWQLPLHVMDSTEDGSPIREEQRQTGKSQPKHQVRQMQPMDSSRGGDSLGAKIMKWRVLDSSDFSKPGMLPVIDRVDPAVYDSISRLQPSKGVKGISDSSYRIIPGGKN